MTSSKFLIAIILRPNKDFQVRFFLFVIIPEPEQNIKKKKIFFLSLPLKDLFWIFLCSCEHWTVVSSWHFQKALRNWENQTFRFAWEYLTGVQISEKMPKFNQKSRILKIFGFLKCYFWVMAISKFHQWEPESTLGRLYKIGNLSWFRFMYSCQI